MHNMKLRINFPPLWLLFWFVTNCIDCIGQEYVEQEALSDTKMAWFLQKKTSSQQYLSPNQAQQINRDAVAGTYDQLSAFYTILIIEQALPMIEVAEYAHFSYEELPVADKKLDFFKSTTIQGLPAAAFAFTGQLDGRFVDYEVEIIEYSGLYYHLVCFRFFNSLEQERVPLSELKPIFRILTDQVPSSTVTLTNQESSGFGFYCLSNTYHDVLYEFSLPINESLGTFFHGHQATEAHPLARIAYKSATKSHLLLPITKQNPLDIIKKISVSSAEQLQHEVCQGYKQKLLAISIYPKEESEEKTNLCSALQIMDDKEQHLKIWQGNRFALLECDAEQSFFQNRYQHHGYDLEFSFRPTDLVELHVEHEYGIDINSSVYFQNHTAQFSGRFIFQENQFLERIDFHQSILSSFLVSSPDIIENGPFLTSSFNLPDVDESVLVASLIRGQTYFHAVFTGSTNNSPVASIPLLFALGSFPAYIQTDKQFIHQRLSFAMNTEKLTQKPTIVTPLEIQDLGEVIQFSEKSIQHTLYVLNSPLINPELVLDLYLSAHPQIIISQEKSNREYKFLDLTVFENSFTIIGTKPVASLLQRTFRRGSTLFVLLSRHVGSPPPCFFHDSGFLLTRTSAQ